MTDGFALAGAAAPKKRGRPPGSKNKRAGDLVGFLDAKCGGTAALQLAQGCMVTVAEVKAAGGSLQRAELAKARRMVEAFDAERVKLDADLRSIVRQELARLVGLAETVTAKAALSMVATSIDRIQLAGGRLTLEGAMERMAEDRRALLPYTDQRQAQQVNVKGEGFAPVMVLVGGSPGEPQKVEQYQGPVIDVPFEVLPSKSHDGEEA